ncbi:hypothetical protein LTR97_012797 [Elasticomyces elasticus]|uniref:Uncharacterized protein n=1 Tax=Elasticomyces elasticus TaxID=574655 RepID=A0AAN7VKM8_9PEZI|nr:hypothetical protein LTR97_012797 [Elasticomyces elasticus]
MNTQEVPTAEMEAVILSEPHQEPTAENSISSTNRASSLDQTADPVDCLLLISVQKGVESMGLKKVESAKLSSSRANPNRRLVAAFGVDNCFTTMMITLKSMMDPLFGFDTTRQDVDSDIQTLASEINAQWLRSKEGFDANNNVMPEWEFKNQEKLRDALKAVFPEKDVDVGSDNPLNYLLPGYETMWRVVLRCFIELTARDHDNASKWCEIMQDFVDNPTDAQLLDRKPSGDGTRTSASQIAKETLRLYPPTRRVYREFETTEGEMKTVSADIETCHRTADVWKPEPLQFIPERWDDKENQPFEDAYFMPFAIKPFNCPAKRRVKATKAEQEEGKVDFLPFAFAMISLLVGTLTRQTAGAWKIVGDVPDKFISLKTEREAYNYLRLERVKKVQD